MSTIGIVPVKRFGAAKQRLSGHLSGSDRQRLARAMLADSLAAIQTSRRLQRLLVVTGDDGAAGIAASFGIEVVAGGPDIGQSPAAAAGIERARASGATRVALLPADCPLVDPDEVDDLLDSAAAVLIVPDRHGTGTNALVLEPPGAIEPSFGEGSCARHAELAGAAGFTPEIRPIPSLGLDLDTPDDLRALRAALSGSSTQANRTREAVGRLPAEASSPTPGALA